MKALLPKHHTARLAPHHHTSYAGIFFLLIIIAALLASVSIRTQADVTDPQQGDVAASAAVAEKVPTTPSITQPSSGQTVTSLPQTVSGSCQTGSVVKIFSNDILIGAATCAGGSYSVPVSLFVGLNSLRAQGFNHSDQGGNSSIAVGATYAPPGGPNPGQFQSFQSSSAAVNQLFIKADVFYLGGKVGQDITWPASLVGGQAPYAVAVSWGDGKSDVYSRKAAGKFDLHHSYAKAPDSGAYNVVMKASDASGNTAYLQLIATTSTPQAAIPVASTGLQIAWPLLIGAVLLVISFILGERFELGKLRRAPAGATA